MNLTKRNHYNPCFWTAFWNPNCYQATLQGSSGNLRTREQVVHALSIKSGLIYTTKVDNVHFDKNMGVAEITLEAAKEFCKRHHPDKYDEFCRESSSDQYPVYIDFEEILTKLEQLPPYRVLLDVIKRQDLTSREEKTFLASFVYLQWLRSHAIMNAMIEWNASLGIQKFEHFVVLKWSLSDTKYLYSIVARLALAHWVLYRTAKDMFPLTDSPILARRKSIMVALSPRLLLKISPGTYADEEKWNIIDRIDKGTLEEFQRRTIGNTFREIIFSDRDMLEQWQHTTEFQKRMGAIQNMTSYNALLIKTMNEQFKL